MKSLLLFFVWSISGAMMHFNAAAEQPTNDLMLYAKIACMELQHDEIKFDDSFVINQPNPNKAELFVFFQKIGLVNPDSTFNDCACSSVMDFDRNKIN